MKFEDLSTEKIYKYMPHSSFTNRFLFRFDGPRPCRFKEHNGVTVVLFFRGCYIIENSGNAFFGSCSFLSLLWQDGDHLCGAEFYCNKEALKDFYENFIFNDNLSFQQNKWLKNDGRLKYFYDLDQGFVFNRKVRYG